ncbi:protein of unknown function [Poseidonocella pacifica]|uniref:DUF4174 domain-containing protein n=1 Tax=Poseidonocella pacifica TaxID=871651 RepID=A0A1I0XA39_9RHOB|nr:DUF4174 domain-containing protein [Poseidonocella pacifica]SFA97939.1 protein of unknown function [Poseidonocella pacifica]
MKSIALLGLAITLTLALAGRGDAIGATEADSPPTIRDAYDLTLSEFHWVNRLVIVFADSPADPRFIEQMTLLNERLHDLELRDVVVLLDTDASARSDPRQTLRPRGFMLVLLDKDGSVLLRKPLPWSVREISRSIDKTPMRQREMRE